MLFVFVINSSFLTFVPFMRRAFLPIICVWIQLYVYLFLLYLQLLIYAINPVTFADFITASPPLIHIRIVPSSALLKYSFFFSHVFVRTKYVFRTIRDRIRTESPFTIRTFHSNFYNAGYCERYGGGGMRQQTKEENVLSPSRSGSSA